MPQRRFDELFTSDLAIEIRGEFLERIEFGVSGSDATAHVLNRYRDLLNDENDGPLIIVCLAAMQFETNCLQAVIRDAALELIRGGDAQRSWASTQPTVQAARRDLLADLAIDLASAKLISDDA